MIGNLGSSLSPTTGSSSGESTAHEVESGRNLCFETESRGQICKVCTVGGGNDLCSGIACSEVNLREGALEINRLGVSAGDGHCLDGIESVAVVIILDGFRIVDGKILRIGSVSV